MPRESGRSRAGGIYAFLWSFAILAFLVAAWLVSQRNAPKFDEGELTAQAQLKKNFEEEKFDPENPPDFVVEKAEIVLSESDGSLKLRFKTDKIIGEGATVGVKEIQAVFALDSGESLVFTATDSMYRIEGKIATVDGEVAGEIPERGQKFTAKRLSWSEDSAVITAFDVEMSDPQFEASGKTMRIELSTGVIEIEDGVRMDM